MIYTQPTEGFTVQRDASGTDCWNASGRLVCVLMRLTPANSTDSAVDVDLREKAGAIMTDLVESSETAGMLAVTKLGGSGPYRTDPSELEELGDRQAFEITMDWGHRA